MLLLNRTGRVVCSSLELTQTPLLSALPSSMITLALSINKITEMKKGSFFWIKPSQKTSMVVSIASRRHAGVHGPRGCHRLC